MKEKLIEQIEQEKDEILEDCISLVKIKTENPPGNEHLTKKFLEDFCKREEINYEIYEKEEGRTNLIMKIGQGKPSLLVACHTDVVPAGDGWETDPYEPVIKDDIIYGRGVADNKGQLASMLAVAKVLKRFEKELKGELVLAAVADEEQGSGLGLGYLLEEGLIDIDFAIIPDVGYNMKKITIAEKGLLHIIVTSIGKQAHASIPESGVNAISNMIKFLNKLESENILRGESPLFTTPTINIGKISGGVASNLVPGKCEVEIDMRFLPEQPGEEIVERVNELIKKTENEVPQSKFEITEKSIMNPIDVPEDHGLIKIIQKNSEEILGSKAECTGLAGTTVSKQLVYKDITSVGFAPGDDEAPHVANEYIAVKELYDFAKVMAGICWDLLVHE